MPLYTGRGDRGETDLMGARVRKDHLRVEVLGVLDELNAALGVARATMSKGPDTDVLEAVQNDLFTIGAELAVSPGKSAPQSFVPVDTARVRELERAIDGLDEKIGRQTAFVLPGGSAAASHLHQARAVARRAERRLVALAGEEDVNPEILRYVNRLSSLLHAMALGANREAGVEERHPRY